MFCEGLFDLDHLGIRFAQGKLIAANRYFHRVAERRNLADENVHTLRDAHVHDAALYGALAMQTNNLAGIADLDLFQCLHWFFLLIS